jgi:hypothetical protein
MVASTGQAYAAFGDNPVNAEDPLGLCDGPDGICTNQNTGEMNVNSSDDSSDWATPGESPEVPVSNFTPPKQPQAGPSANKSTSVTTSVLEPHPQASLIATLSIPPCDWGTACYSRVAASMHDQYCQEHPGSSIAPAACPPRGGNDVGAFFSTVLNFASEASSVAWACASWGIPSGTEGFFGGGPVVAVVAGTAGCGVGIYVNSLPNYPPPDPSNPPPGYSG